MTIKKDTTASVWLNSLSEKQIRADSSFIFSYSILIFAYKKTIYDKEIKYKPAE